MTEDCGGSWEEHVITAFKDGTLSTLTCLQGTSGTPAVCKGKAGGLNDKEGENHFSDMPKTSTGIVTMKNLGIKL